MHIPASSANQLSAAEDHRFLTGTGQYTDDITLPWQSYACFMRSPHAHAKIRGIDTAAALAEPGVLGVFTSRDLAEVGGLPCGWLIHSVDGTPMKEPKHPVLAEDKVRHVGDQVALVVAETLAQAKAAAALIDVDYDVLPAVVGTATATQAGTAVHDIAPDNVCYTWELGDKAAVDAAFDQAAHVTRLSFVNNRVIPNAMEPRAANAAYSRADDSYTVYVGSQNPHLERLLMAAFVLGLPEHKLRVIAPDVGGGFGSKTYLYAEETALVWASKRIGRPVKWTAERSESFLTDAHGRDHVTTAELALDASGKFLALRADTTANLGAYLSTFSSCIPTILHATLLAGQYATPAIHCTVRAVFTNTAPVDAYRGAGRTEATYLVERIVETAARELEIDPVELRRRNFIRTFPYATPVALVYDTGDYETTLNRALELADVQGFAVRKVESAKKGLLRGIGYSCYIEACGIAPTAYVPHNYPLDELEPGLDENAFYDPANFTFPAGSYVCEVEVDPAVGTVRIDRFVACDDFGNVVNPMIVEGQVHGGLAQGIGQALLEGCVYNDDGQLVTGTYSDYTMPRADDLPRFVVETVKGTPCTHNPLGVKGCGEAGAIGSPPAVINAIVDALAEYDVRDVPMPATPYTVWKILHAARSERAA